MANKTQKRSKLRPALLLAGLAGGVVAAVRKRAGGSEQLQQAASQAAGKAQEAVVGDADAGADRDRTRRFASEAADPSLDTTRAHDLPADVAMPDVSDDDPSVREAEADAAADAGSIGDTGDAEPRP